MTSIRPRALLFDWDNTLIDSWDTIHQALTLTFSAMGHKPWTMAETKLKVARSIRDSFPQLFGARWEEAARLYVENFTSIHIDSLKVAEGAAALLEQLTLSGFYLGVISNKIGEVLRRETAHLGWNRYFRRVVGAGDAALDKPDPAPLQLALDGTGIASADAWYVGDTALDMEFAGRSGCLPVLLGGGAREERSFARFPPALHFQDCAALARYLSGP